MKHQFFKITGLILIIVMLFSLIGCTSASETKSSTSDKAKSAEVKKHQENKATSETQKNNDQTAAPPTAAQQNTSAPAQTSSTPATSSPSSTAQKQTVSTVKNSAPAASVQPKQWTSTTTNTQQSTATSSAATSTNTVPVQNVKISVIGPKDKGTIINGKTINIKTGESVLDVLIDAVGKTNIDYSGSGATAYVRGIDNIYEFDYGPKSGWTVSQNGTRLTRSAGAIQVKSGDNIEWKYTEDYTVN